MLWKCLFSQLGVKDRDLDPATSDVSVVLSFPQEMLDKQRSSSTIKVYAAAIEAFHGPIAGRSVDFCHFCIIVQPNIYKYIKAFMCMFQKICNNNN